MNKLKTMKHTSKLDVLISGNRVGGLAKSDRGEIWFEYDPVWIKSGFDLSPMKQFDLKLGAFKPTNNIFSGLHGVFNDALPDGWGLLLMDRAVKKNLGWDPHEISPLDRLAYIGGRAMGALKFRPAMASVGATPAPSLENLAEDAMLVQEGVAEEILSALYIYGGSPGGARPKVTLAIERGGDRCMSGFEDIPENFDHWIVKFRTQMADPDCMGRIEMAYAKMAEAAKIEMPATRLITVMARGKKEEFFAVQRFDRIGNTKRHVISLGGMLEISHRAPSIDYSGLLKAVSFVTKDVGEIEKAFRLMVFNVLAHNKDDHVKNFSFIRDHKGWSLTPAYDLTFSGGMSNQHMTSVSGEGNPTLGAIRKIAEDLQINKWEETVREVHDAVSLWGKLAVDLQVPKTILNKYRSAIEASPCFVELEKHAKASRSSSPRSASKQAKNGLAP
jgi:serine/threonine-protein kinase HipA